MNRDVIRDQGGFTLIEMVVVVLMVSILASAAMPLAAMSKRRAQEAELRQSLRLIRGALDDYKRAWDQGRIEHKPDQSGYPPNLNVLVQGVADVSSTKTQQRIYFLRRLPRDPFASAELTAAATWGLRSYASPADEPIPGTDVFDVYSLTQGVGLDGTPYRRW
ncbi:MAG: type II secretion system protein [Burkholderiales bacterium]|nr:type II secretion system protein [Burkholderiales bacterium]